MRSCLQKGPLKDQIEWRTPRAATVEELTTVHDPEYVAMLEKASETGKKFGVSTTLHKGLWRPIVLAAGAAVSAVDAVLKGARFPPRMHSCGLCSCRLPAAAVLRARCSRKNYRRCN